jgi:ABC-type proline/glycine betaine transport system permease subunit
LAFLLAVAAVRLQPHVTRMVAVAALIYAVPHLAYHALHLEPYGVGDAIANVVTLGLAVLVPCWLAISPTPRGDPAPADPRTTEVEASGR